ncbi:hypothetical protein LSH36_1112g00088 [Paralvinella palmiformis]|uniref:ABC-2 type transporter transmembrane domain-containing protein n=1 Tax=Paralvinella palmiformis TaxID=53620 RepID=A0AAD9IUU8_9ANNE|nr:hypothetical protein LSH36_1112g00088 [Paralvinella palmiformis]
MNTLAIIPGEEEDSNENILKICNSFDESVYFERIEYQIQEQIENHNANPILKVQKLSKEASDRHILPFILQLLSILCGMMYGHQTYTQSGVDNINAVLFLLVTQPMFHISLASLVVNDSNFLETFPTLVKDHYDRTYTVSAYCSARILIEVGFTCIVVPEINQTLFYNKGLYPEPKEFFTVTAAIMLLGCLAVENGTITYKIYY